MMKNFLEDYYNPPRKINVEKAYNTTYNIPPNNYSEPWDIITDAIKYPPIKHPESNGFVTDTSTLSNQLKEKSWQFKYRWVYDDYEKSAWSPVSPSYIDESFNPKFNVSGIISYNNNVLPIKFSSGGELVTRIQIAVRNTNGQEDFVLIADIDKKNVTEDVLDTGVVLPISFNGLSSLTLATNLVDNQIYELVFYNGGIYSILDLQESNKLYDDIPHQAKAQEIVDGNRIVYGNVITGQTVDKTLDINFTAKHPDDSVIADNISDVSRYAQYQLQSEFHDHSNKQRRWRCGFKMRFPMPEMSVDCKTKVYMNVKDFVMTGIRSSYYNHTNNPVIRGAYAGIFNVDYTSNVFTAGTTSFAMAQSIVNDLNATTCWNAISLAVASPCGGNTLGTDTSGWSVVTTGGDDWVQFNVMSTSTINRDWWTNANVRKIKVRKGGQSIQDAGLGGNDSVMLDVNTNYKMTFAFAPKGLNGNPNGAQVTAGLNPSIGGNEDSNYFSWDTVNNNIRIWIDKDVADNLGLSNNYMYCSDCDVTNSADVTELERIANNTVLNLYNHSYERICGSPNFKTIAPSFKTGAKHRFGLVYYDRGNRSSSVQLGRVSDIYIPRVAEEVPTYTDSSGSSFNYYTGEWYVNWEIHHEPPAWATHYQWVYGGNTLTDNFIQFVTDGIYDGKFAERATTPLETVEADHTSPTYGNWQQDGTYQNNILVDITNIRNYQRAESSEVVHYTFQEGDMLRFVLDKIDVPALNSPYEFKIVGVVGEGDNPRIVPSTKGGTYSTFDDKEFILLAREDVLINGGTNNYPAPLSQFEVIDTATPDPVYELYNLEIYSPKKKTDDDQRLYFEFGHVGNISSDPNIPGKRIHERIDFGYQSQQLGIQPATGTFLSGDVYYRYRQTKSIKSNTFIESFHYSDLFVSNYYDKGRPNAVLVDFKRSRKYATCLYSEAYIPNTNINGLNSIFPGISFQEYEKSYNSIQRLHTVDESMIIFQEDKVSKALVSRDIIFDADAKQNVAISKNVLSPAVAYNGDYGICRNPESFAYYGFRSYFFDIRRGAVLRLSKDGLTPISEHGMKEFFTDYCQAWLDAGRENSFKIYGVYDTKFDEYVISADTLDTDIGRTVYGCMNPNALNYNPLATTPCTTIIYSPVSGTPPVLQTCCIVEGCTDPAAHNYDPLATVDNGSCEYDSCLDPLAINYNANGLYDCSGVIPGTLPGNTSCCTYCDGVVNSSFQDHNDLPAGQIHTDAPYVLNLMTCSRGNTDLVTSIINFPPVNPGWYGFHSDPPPAVFTCGTVGPYSGYHRPRHATAAPYIDPGTSELVLSSNGISGGGGAGCEPSSCGVYQEVSGLLADPAIYKIIITITQSAPGGYIYLGFPDDACGLGNTLPPSWHVTLPAVDGNQWENLFFSGGWQGTCTGGNANTWGTNFPIPLPGMPSGTGNRIPTDNVGTFELQFSIDPNSAGNKFVLVLDYQNYEAGGGAPAGTSQDIRISDICIERIQ